MKTLLTALVTLLLFSSCNSHEISICKGRELLNLDQHLGEISFMGVFEEGGKLEDAGTVNLIRGSVSGTYTMVDAMAGEEEDVGLKNVFTDAVVCQIGGQKVVEGLSQLDEDYLSLIFINETSEGKLELGMPFYNTDKLEALNIPFESATDDAIGKLMIMVDNKNVSAENLISTMEVVDMMISK
jgi:hypothetical protein